MRYNEKVTIKNGKEIYIRNAEAADGSSVLENFNLTHEQTDYLLSYSDERTFTPEKKAFF